MTADPDKLRNAPIIGLTGKAGSGKSTAANWLLDKNGKAIHMAFAQPLKVMIYELIRKVTPRNHPHTAADYIRDPVLKEQPIPFVGGFTARYLMQTLGTEWGRNAVHKDFWVSIMAIKLERLFASGFANFKDQPLRVVIDDVRFDNEAEMIRHYGGVVVRVVRPDAEKPAEIAGHASEAMDFAVDVTIVNGGTVEDLHALLEATFPPPPKVERYRNGKLVKRNPLHGA